MAERLGGRLLLRSGCYVTHDHGVYERTGPGTRGALDGAFEPALEVWAPVLSRPEAGRALVGAGKRDLAYDMGLPIVLAGLPGRVVALNDQHAHLEIDARSDLRPGISSASASRIRARSSTAGGRSRSSTRTGACSR